MRYAVKVTARAKQTRVTLAADGTLQVAVTAPPERGRANAAVIAALAAYWNVPQRAVRIAQSASSRRKVVALDRALP